MNKILNNHGLTLTELIVASVLIGIVMAGIGAFSVSVKNLHSNSSKRSLLSMRLTGVMREISRDASLATGDNINQGIMHESDPGNNREYACFRRDLNATPTPDDYTDDQWVCYHKSGNELYKCDPVSPQPADGYCDINNAFYLTNVESVTVEDTFAIVQGADARIQSVTVNLLALYNPSENWHPVDNPSYRLRANISPTGHSR